MVIFEGFRRAVDEGAPKESGGILVDEQFGADIARTAKKEGFNFAMPSEKSGQDEYDFQYGDDFGAHIEEFDPTFSKVLVRYNPEGDAGMNERQSARLKQLGDWLHDHGRKFLRSEERRVGKSGDLGGSSSMKKKNRKRKHR